MHSIPSRIPRSQVSDFWKHIGIKSLLQFLLEPIICHAWNRDSTQIALSPQIMTCTSTRRMESSKDMSWRNTVNTPQLLPGFLRATALSLTGHTAALVWSQKDGIYSPTLVILRTNYLATFVKMTPLENKFSVWSRVRLISVYYFESENGWWVSKHIKKLICSTTPSFDWHPNNVWLSAASCDFKCRVFVCLHQRGEWDASHPTLGQPFALWSADI